MEQEPATRPATGEQDGVRRGGRPGDAHDQAQIGHQAVIGAKHRRPQRIAAAAAMTALERRHRWTGKAAASRCGGADDPGMGALVGRQAAGDGFRLVVIGVDVAGFAGRDRRQDEGRAEPRRQPGQGPRPEAWRELHPMHALVVQVAAPELGVRALHRGELAVDGGQVRIRLGLGQDAIERRTVDLALQIGAIALDVLGLRHGRRLRGGPARRARLQDDPDPGPGRADKV